MIVVHSFVVSLYAVVSERFQTSMKHLRHVTVLLMPLSLRKASSSLQMFIVQLILYASVHSYSSYKYTRNTCQVANSVIFSNMNCSADHM
jgi:hypothetical protein